LVWEAHFVSRANAGLPALSPSRLLCVCLAPIFRSIFLPPSSCICTKAIDSLSLPLPICLPPALLPPSPLPPIPYPTTLPQNQVFGLLLAEACVLALPLDVANNSSNIGCAQGWVQSCGGLDMHLFWTIMYVLVTVLCVAVLPFAIFYYEVCF
jgi:hypothetical protein